MRFATALTSVIICGVGLAGCATSSPSIDGRPSTSPGPALPWTAPAAAMPADTTGRTAAPDTVTAAALSQLSIATVVDLALRNNPATRISWAEARAAADQYGASRGMRYPDISGDVSVSRTQSANSNSAGERTQYGPSLTLSYLAFDFGGRSGAIEAARQAAIAANFAHNVAINNTILEAQSAAFDYLAARSLRDAERAAVNEAAGSLSAAEERHRVGLATIADVLQARTAQAEEQLNLETLEGQVQVTRGSLAVAMGLPPTTSFDLPDISAPDSSTVHAAAQSADSLISIAVRSRPDLGAAQADAARAAAEVRVANSARFPTLAFGANGGYAGSNVSAFSGRTYGLSLGLSIPLFNGRAREFSARAAAAERDAANARTQLTRQQIALQVFTSYYTLQTATERVRTSTDLLASALASDSVTLGRYTEGVGSIVDLLIAQTQLSNARGQAVSARWQWRTALAVLAHDAGTFDIHGEPLVPLAGIPGSNR